MIDSSAHPMDDPAWAWAPFEPAAGRKWDLPCVAHLHRRAGFAAPWPILERDLRDGPSATLERLLYGEQKSGDGTPAAEFESTLDEMAAQLAPSADLTRIQAIWLYRMIFTPHPLRERMTLFWHNHFATSNVKVQSPLLMQRQNDLLRAQALGDFRALLTAIGKDPAMLIWLDSTINRKAKPNENYAREVMELFTLGRGHYTEKDIQEAARAFTGWFVRSGPVRGGAAPARRRVEIRAGTDRQLDRRRHSRHPARAARVRRVHLPQAVPPLRERDADAVRPADRAAGPCLPRLGLPDRKARRDDLALEPFLRPEHPPAAREEPGRVCRGDDPALEILNPTVQTSALAEACGRMGQSLYAPPSVAGWDGGPGWINSTAMLARANLALGLLSDQNDALGERCNPWLLATQRGFGRRDASPVSSSICWLKVGLEPKAREQIEKAATAKKASDEAAAREVVRLILTSPEYQLA